MNAFTCDLYARLKGREGNLVVSPYSVSAALAIAYAGARGETAEQMARTLHYPPDQGHLHPAFSALRSELLDRKGGAGPDVRLANALWLQQDYPLRASYVELVRQYYGAALNTADFRRGKVREEACSRINDWVSEKTRSKIERIVAPEQLSGLTRLIITNAVYFLGDWTHRFQEASTQARPFWTAPHDSIDVPMMSQTEKFLFAHCESLSVLEMGFTRGLYSLVILLPTDKDGLGRIEKGLRVENLNAWLSTLSTPRVELYVPKFKLTSEYRLGGALAAMGMPLAFQSGANFSGATERKPLWIDEVTHKAFIEVNERGAEAAAVTAVEIIAGIDRLKPDPPVVFRADHPFLYLIRHRTTGCILFLGRVVDPRS